MANNAFTLDVGPFQKAMVQLAERDVRIAAVWALNDTAEDALNGVKDRINVVFDQPNTYTQNAFQVRRAKTTNLEAAVEERPKNGGRHYLKMQETGGPRRKTGLEGTFSRTPGYEGIIQTIIPAEDAELDQYGNWSGRERNRVMSQLGIQRDSTANETERSKKRNGRKRSRYFVPKTGLAPGVYKRRASDDIPLRVLKFTDKVPVYHQRLGFFDEVGKVFQAEFPKHMSRTLGRMIAKRFG